MITPEVTALLRRFNADADTLKDAGADIGAKGPYDGMGNYDPQGSYIHLFISVDGAGPHTFRTSHGGAEQLLRELQIALRLDIDRLTGSVIDAYTLAPNDEDEKREAVRSAIARELAR